MTDRITLSLIGENDFPACKTMRFDGAYRVKTCGKSLSPCGISPCRGSSRRTRLYFRRKAADGESIVRKLVQIGQLLHVAIPDLAARFVRRVQSVVATRHSQGERGVSDEAAEADLLFGSAACGDLGQVAAR